VSDSGPDTKSLLIQGSILNTYFQTITAEIRIIDTADTKQIIVLSKTRS